MMATAYVDVGPQPLTYRVTLDSTGKPVAVCRRLHFGFGPDLALHGSTGKRVLQAWRDQVAKGGRGHV